MGSVARVSPAGRLSTSVFVVRVFFAAPPRRPSSVRDSVLRDVARRSSFEPSLPEMIGGALNIYNIGLIAPEPNYGSSF